MTSSKRPEQPADLRGLRASELEMNPRRYPRTMQEAFGPYVTRDLEPPRGEGYPWLWWAALALAGLTTLILVVLTR